MALLAADPVFGTMEVVSPLARRLPQRLCQFLRSANPGSQAAQERSIGTSVVIDDTSHAERVERQFDQFAKVGVLRATRAESRSRAVNDS